jgi:hypothetical protein
MDQSVVRDHGDAFGAGHFDRGADRVRVLCDEYEDRSAARDQALHVGELLLGRALGVGRHVARAESLEFATQRRLVGLPALFLEVGPAHAHDETVLARTAEVGEQKQQNQQRERRPAPARSRDPGNAVAPHGAYL